MKHIEYSLSTSRRSFYLECNRQKSADRFIVEPPYHVNKFITSKSKFNWFVGCRLGGHQTEGGKGFMRDA